MSGTHELGLAAARVSRLSTTGLPVAPGTDQAYLPCDANSADTTFTFNTGAEITKIGGYGEVCFYNKRPDGLKGGTLKMGFCSSSYALIEMLVNGPAELFGGATPTGFGLSAVQCGELGARGGVMVDYWVQNFDCTAQIVDTPYKQKVIPRWFANYEGGINDGSTAKDFILSGDFVPGVLAPTGAPAGPFGDWTDATVDKGYLYAEQDATTIPTCTDDYANTTVAT